jgi:hypothetical protein
MPPPEKAVSKSTNKETTVKAKKETVKAEEKKLQKGKGETTPATPKAKKQTTTLKKKEE